MGGARGGVGAWRLIVHGHAVGRLTAPWVSLQKSTFRLRKPRASLAEITKDRPAQGSGLGVGCSPGLSDLPAPRCAPVRVRFPPLRADGIPSRARIGALFAMGVLAHLMTQGVAAATRVRLEFIEAGFHGDTVAGTVVLRESSTGDPIPGQTVFAKLDSGNRDATQWMPFGTDEHGKAHITIPRLYRKDGTPYDTSRFFAEFNIRRDGGLTDVDPNFTSARVDRTIPTASGAPPRAGVEGPKVGDATVPPDEICIGRDLQFISLSYSADAPVPDPNYGIDDWYWTIRDPTGTTTRDNGPATFFRTRVAGVHELQLIVWDLHGRVGSTTRTFIVQDGTYISQEFVRGFGSCPANATGPRPPTRFGTEFANGHVEVQCVQGNPVTACYDFVVRWHEPNGAVKIIGLCTFPRGENSLVIQADTCTRRIVHVRWLNAEGHYRTRTGCVDDANGNGRYDGNSYNYFPETGRFRLDRLYKPFLTTRTDCEGHPWPLPVPWKEIGPWQYAAQQEWPAAAANQEELLRRLGDPDLCPIEDSQPSSYALFFGKAARGPGTAELRIAGRLLTVPLEGGESPAEVARRLSAAANADDALRALGVGSEVNAQDDAGVASLEVLGAAESELAVSVTGPAGPGLNALTPEEIPILSTTARTPTSVTLTWPRGRIPFVLEAGTVTAAGIEWRTTTLSVISDSGTNYAHVPSIAEPQLFRLGVAP